MTGLDPDIVIVLVDDNQDDRDLAARALERAGVANEVVMLSDGVEALQFFDRAIDTEAGAARTYLVLLDLNMPRLGGLDLLRILRSRPSTRRLQIVVLTSSDEERDLVDSYELGANSYIRKPVDFAQFSDMMRQLGFYWLALNRPAPGGLKAMPKNHGSVAARVTTPPSLPTLGARAT